MISQNELRVGNWVADHNNYMIKELIGRFIEVEDICWGGINSEVSYGSISPGVDFKNLKGITLTPEILGKCGFEMVHPLSSYSRYVLADNLGTDINLKCDWSIKGFIAVYYAGEFIKYIEFLHQLQNIVWAVEDLELEVSL